MTAARCAACCVWYWQAVWRVAVRMPTGEEAGEKGLTSGDSGIMLTSRLNDCLNRSNHATEIRSTGWEVQEWAI